MACGSPFGTAEYTVMDLPTVCPHWKKNPVSLFLYPYTIYLFVMFFLHRYLSGLRIQALSCSISTKVLLVQPSFPKKDQSGI